MVKKYLLFLLIGLIHFSCGNNESVLKLDEQFVSKLQQERENKDWEMQYDNYSPLKLTRLQSFNH